MSRPFVALVLVILSAAAIACSATEATSGSPTPAPSATTVVGTQVPTSNCPVAVEVCTVAEDVLKAAQARDFSAIVNAGQPMTYVCPGAEPQGLGGPFPLCHGAARGTQMPGFPIAYLQSEGIVTNADGVLQAINRWASSARPDKSDTFASGANALYTVACPEEAKACADSFAVILSNIGEVPYRMFLILFFKHSEGKARLTWTAIGPMLDLREESVMLNGGKTNHFFRFEGWPQLNTFYSIKR